MTIPFIPIVAIMPIILSKRQERIDNRRAEQARAANLYRTELEWMRRMPQARGHKAKYREDASATETRSPRPSAY